MQTTIFTALDPCMVQLGNRGELQGRKNMGPHMYNITVRQFSGGGGCDWIRGTEMVDLQEEEKGMATNEDKVSGGLRRRCSTGVQCFF